MRRIYIIAGPNGAGKTVASHASLSKVFDCNEFVNADEIARALSPFNPESMAIKSGRLMLGRIRELLDANKSFAFETTLSTKSYVSLIKESHKKGYSVTLYFLYLNSVEIAMNRVHTRVQEGGHNIPPDVIKRRYNAGLKNFFNLYKDIVDSWVLLDNSEPKSKLIASKSKQFDTFITNNYLWYHLKNMYYGK